MPDEEPFPPFESLLQHLKQSRGFDFTGYKRTSLRRRIDKRMRAVAVDDYERYIEYLELHPDEFVTLFNMILINVTGFLRDTATWTYLREDVLPQYLEQLEPTAPIRVWSAGCASGEEAYSLAIGLAEILGVEQFTNRVKIYGTDVDEEALQTARHATYSEREIGGLPAELKARYFEDGEGKYTFRSDLRRSVIFGRLDLLRDAPISRLDLLSCRNTLMYLNAETQAQVLDRFHFALRGGGVLLLGKAETLLSHSVLFEPIDRRRRIFRKVPGIMPARRDTDRSAAPPIPIPTTGLGESLAGAAMDASPIAMIVVDREGNLAHANEQARTSFGVSARDHGRPFQDLELSYRPVELRGPIEQAYTERHSVVLRGSEWMSRGGTRILDVEVSPLRVAGETAGALVVFVDVTQQRELEDRLRQSNQDLEQAYEEVQSTNEELETTNEELHSTIEELETTNEELQSTNEELETMNEELQSTNDELHAVNEEVRVRGDEVDELNHFLNAILASLRGGVVVVDADRNVRIWNDRAEDLWGLRESEVRATDFLKLDIGLPVTELADALAACLGNRAEPAELDLDAVTRRGRHVRCHVTMNPLGARDGERGAIMVMDAEERA
ncbi:MAG: two-component system, chemotaxis family, CheB/CheR fusion protein [Actinomycetota bacterium]|nr:two-component system, chemotaxis family, CheB/CheR fusion protein [Actinomycetota bacterium]